MHKLMIDNSKAVALRAFFFTNDSKFYLTPTPQSNIMAICTLYALGYTYYALYGEDERDKNLFFACVKIITLSIWDINSA